MKELTQVSIKEWKKIGPAVEGKRPGRGEVSFPERNKGSRSTVVWLQEKTNKLLAPEGQSQVAGKLGS